jgi:hypothetical protein
MYCRKRESGDSLSCCMHSNPAAHCVAWTDPDVDEELWRQPSGLVRLLRDGGQVLRGRRQRPARVDRHELHRFWVARAIVCCRLHRVLVSGGPHRPALADANSRLLQGDAGQGAVEDTSELERRRARRARQTGIACCRCTVDEKSRTHVVAIPT